MSREGVELEGTRSRAGETPRDCDATGKGDEILTGHKGNGVVVKIKLTWE